MTVLEETSDCQNILDMKVTVNKSEKNWNSDIDRCGRIRKVEK